MNQIVGTLCKNKFDKYEIGDYQFSCGSSIQIFHQDSGYWLTGRVEHATELGGYYFYSDYPDIPSFPLREGMRVRVGYPEDHVAPWMMTKFLEYMGYSLIDALREKNEYPDHYKKEVKEAYKSLDRFLSEVDKLPFFDA